MGRFRKISEWLLLSLATLVVLALLFVNVGPRIFPYEALIVRSGSMSPTIPTGSLVLYHKINANALKVGDVIVFTEPNDPSEKVTHRIYSIGTDAQGRYFRTKGDANGLPDAWTVPAVGIGWIAFYHVPVVGYMLADLQGGYVRVALIVVPALVLATLALMDVRRSRGSGSGSVREKEVREKSPRERRQKATATRGSSSGDAKPSFNPLDDF